MTMPAVKRVLLKLSGEVLMGDQQFGIDPATVAALAQEVKEARDGGLRAKTDRTTPNKTRFEKKMATGERAMREDRTRDLVRY